VPDLPARRISRDALERIIKRAAELQAGDLETGEEMTEQELLKLGAEVGIDGRFLRQALYEERAGAAPAERGALAKWVGPAQVGASRVVPGDREAVERALEQWMTEGEALTVKRRLPERTLWERQRGFFAEMRRGLGMGGKSYQLAKARDVAVAVTQLEPGYCHVEMLADTTPSRDAAASGGLAVASILIAGGIAGSALGAPLVVPVFAAAAGLASGAAIGAAHRRVAERTQLALEQVLDRLERGEIKERHKIEGRGGFDLGSALFQRVAGEIRRALADVSEPGRRSSRRLPPGAPNH
jgi:hypothetical protein